jgi:hypothetical protein
MISASLNACLRPSRTSQPNTRIMIRYSRRRTRIAILPQPADPAKSQLTDPASSSEAVQGRELWRQGWHWALAHQASDGSLPGGREIADQYGRHERWGRQSNAQVAQAVSAVSPLSSLYG